MSKESVTQEHEHELMGMLLDAFAGHRRGAEASMFMEAMRAKIKGRLSEIYDACERDVRGTKNADIFGDNNGKDKASERANVRTGK